MPHRAGFTLLEVVLGLALMFVITGAAANLAWTIGDRRTALHRLQLQGVSGDAVIQSITDDLVASVAYPDPAALPPAADDQPGAAPLVIVGRAPAGMEAIDPPRSGLVRSVYTLESSGRLTRTRTPYEGGEATAVPLAEGIERVDFRVHNGFAWVSLGEAVRGSTVDEPVWPRAVEVALWFGEAGEDVSARPPDRLRVIAVPDAGSIDDDRGRLAAREDR